MAGKLSRSDCLLLIPANDAEAIQIIRVARSLGIETLVSEQPHGARLEREPDLFKRLAAFGKSHLVIVEMPGPKVEEEIRKSGFSVYVIDHHRYDDLDRSNDPATGTPLLSSLEQFLAVFDVTDEELRAHSFEPRLVRGVGAMDRGFLWALLRDGYSQEEIKAISRTVQELSRTVRGDEGMILNEEEARRAWVGKRKINSYWLVKSDRPGVEIRPMISVLAAEEFGQPTPTIIASRGGLLFYVQDTPHALDLFQKFGGFTFGQDTCWGYNNALAKTKITLEELLGFLNQLSVNHPS